MPAEARTKHVECIEVVEDAFYLKFGLAFSREPQIQRSDQVEFELDQFSIEQFAGENCQESLR